MLDVLSNTDNAMMSTSGGPLPMQSKDLTVAPKWLSDSITKKRNVVPISMLMEDVMSKCLGRATKTKRLKVETMIILMRAQNIGLQILLSLDLIRMLPLPQGPIILLSELIWG